MKRTKLLLLCQYFHPEYVSSATLPTQLAEDLAAEGFSVNVLCGYPYEYYTGTAVPRVEKYKKIAIRRIIYINANRSTSVGRTINNLSFTLSSFLQLVKLSKYDCVLVYSNPPILTIIAYFSSVLFGTPYIFIAYDVYPDLAIALGKIKKNGLLAQFMRIINQKVYARAKKIIVLGDEMKNYLLDSHTPVDSEKIVKIYNWYQDIDKSTINYFVEDKKNRERKVFTVLYSGNMGICQDMETIKTCIAALKNKNEIRFVLCGHGNKKNSIRLWIKENNMNNAELRGFVTGDEYNALLVSADCCLVSLEKNVEGLSVPSKTYGYLAAGKPVMAIMSSETDIAKNLIQFDAGLQFNQGDGIGLAKAIEMLAMDGARTIEVGANARRLFESTFARSICTSQYGRLLRQITRREKDE